MVPAEKQLLQYNRPVGIVQQSCHSAAASVGVDVLSLAPPTPSAVVHVLSPASFSPGRSTVAATVVQFVPASCPTPVGQ